VLRGNRALVAVIIVAAQMAVFFFFSALSIVIPVISSEVCSAMLQSWACPLPDCVSGG
jgi:hypothetical protein